MTLKITPSLISKLNATIDAGLSAGLGTPEPGKMCVEAAVCYALGLPHSDNPPCVNPLVRNLKITLNDSSAWSSNEARAKGLKRLAIAQLGTNENFDEQLFIKELVRTTIEFVKELYKEPMQGAKKWNEWADNYLSSKDISADAASSAAHAARSAARYAASSAAYAASFAADAASSAAYAARYAANSAARYAANSAANSAARYAANSAARYAASSAAYAASFAVNAAISAAYAASYAANSVDSSAVNAVKDTVLADYCERVVQILIKMNTEGSKWL